MKVGEEPQGTPALKENGQRATSRKLSAVVGEVGENPGGTRTVRGHCST